ncbi:hypothetical protein vseg_011779 [Gypsophila vaccaria]
MEAGSPSWKRKHKQILDSWDWRGARVWKRNFGCGGFLSMQWIVMRILLDDVMTIVGLINPSMALVLLIGCHTWCAAKRSYVVLHSVCRGFSLCLSRTS